MTDPLSIPSDYEGIRIDTPRLEQREGRERLVLHGIFSIYVKGGAQMAIWSGFPKDIQVFATEVASGAQYESFDLSRSQSPDEDTVSLYASMPQDQVVQERFEIVLLDKLSALQGKSGQFELSAQYLGQVSNSVRVKLP